MIRTVQSEAVPPTTSPAGTALKEYLGGLGKVVRGPQAYLASTGKAGVIEPHFHTIDQFQIFVRGGELRLGKAEVPPVTVHYTDGFSPYGPIEWGEDGMAFFNLRARADLGAHYMPEGRKELRRRAGRHAAAQCSLARPAEAESTHERTLIEEHDDGLLAFETVAGPGQGLRNDVVRGAGRYELVLSGSLELADEELSTESLLFASAGEQLPARKAGSDGAHVLTVQLPTD